MLQGEDFDWAEYTANKSIFYEMLQKNLMGMVKINSVNTPSFF